MWLWEAITTFVAIKDAHLTHSEKNQNITTEVNGGAVVKGEVREVGKKSDLGKGTDVIVKFVNSNLAGDANDSSGLLMETHPIEFNLTALNPYDSRLVSLLIKVKEILLCKEKRRLPKIPKVLTEILLSKIYKL